MSQQSIVPNNFDLLRLFASLQVAILHVSRSVSQQYDGSLSVRVIEVFSGVPIFFFISGFLISRAFERSQSLADYTLNRVLRIFPALHVCVLLNLIAVAATGYFALTHTHLSQIALLYLAKTTFLQFYNPAFMRGFGDGVLNGSLWTICVELQFYVLTPVIYAVLLSTNRKRSNLALLALIAASLACNRFLYEFQGSYGGSTEWKLARVSFLPWIYMFLSGVMAQRNFDVVSRFLGAAPFWAMFIAYLLYGLGLQSIGFAMDNSFSPLLFFPLAALICAAAYYPSKSLSRLLKGNDISYGIYIYHVPVMSMFLYYGYRGSIVLTCTIVTMTVVIAMASWIFVERPALRRKHRPSRAILNG